MRMKENVGIDANFRVVTTSGKQNVAGSSIAFVNTGDDDATIAGNYPLSAGTSLELSASEDRNVVQLDITIKFAGSGANPQINIIELMPREPGYGKYVPK